MFLYIKKALSLFKKKKGEGDSRPKTEVEKISF